MEDGDRGGGIRQATLNPVEEKEGRSLGPALLVVGALAIIFARDIPKTGIGDNSDPGAQAFPVALGATLALGGMIEMLAGLFRRRRAGVAAQKTESGAPSATASSTESGWRSVFAALVDERNRDVILLLAALCVYIPAISILGFSISTFVFAGALMIRLGARGVTAWLTSLGLIVVIRLLFVTLFKVQLPRGIWDLPF